MRASLRTVGATRVRNDLRSFVAKNKALFDPIVGDHVKYVRKQLSKKKYPSKRPGQTYVRTGRLGSSYRARRVSMGVWLLSNSAPYSGWVVNEATQTRGHKKNKWYTIQQEERKYRPRLTRAITQRAEQHFG